MKISILDAQHTIFEGAVSEAILPALDGEVCLMDDHEPIFVALGKGAIRLVSSSHKVAARVEASGAQKTDETKRIKPIHIHRGLARMRRNALIILVE